MYDDGVYKCRFYNRRRSLRFGGVLHNFILYINDFLTFLGDNNSRVTTEDVRINDR